MVDTVMRFLWNPWPQIRLGPKAAEEDAIVSWSRRMFARDAGSAWFSD